MLCEKDIPIISYLRKDGRIQLTKVSRSTGMPVSTIFDRMRLYEKELVQKYTALIDFPKLGFHTKALVSLRVDKSDRELCRAFLENQSNVNSMYKINNGFDFMVELVFKNMKDLELFLERVESKVKIKTKNVYYVIEDIKRESFLDNPQTISLIE